MSQKKFRRLEGCGIKSMRPIFKTEMLIYQSKANLYERILFDKTIYHFLSFFIFNLSITVSLVP